LEQTLIQAVWAEAVHPLTGLDASHPPAAFVALAGHGANDADIPGAARVWVRRQGDGERHYVGFGDLWRTPLNLQSIYLSSCVVGMTREVNGEPLGLLSASLLRGARYVVGWTVPVDDLGVALFSLLYHWAWRERVTARAYTADETTADVVVLVD
jgi:CHAT domain